MKLNRSYLTAACTQEHIINVDKFCRKAPPGDFMECGVLRGGTAGVMINAAGPKRKVWLCDTFDIFFLPGPEDIGYTTAPAAGNPIAKVQQRLIGWDLSLDNVVFVRGKFGDTLPETMKKIKRLAFVHFDGDWYESVMQAFPHILKKLCPGGIMIIHDYPTFKGLKKAVHKFIDPKDLHPFTNPAEPANVYYIKEG